MSRYLPQAKLRGNDFRISTDENLREQILSDEEDFPVALYTQYFCHAARDEVPFHWHENDLFVLDGIQSVSARDKILREIISNSLAHRDYSSGYVPKLLIEKDKITVENGNRAHGIGALDIRTFEPFAKNPPISKVFREIGYADELSSGMRNSYKYTLMYSGAEPEFIEGDVFKIIIPLSVGTMTKVGPETSPVGSAQVSAQVCKSSA